MMLLYQAQFNLKGSFKSFPYSQHTLLWPYLRVNILIHVTLNERLILIYSMY